MTRQAAKWGLLLKPISDGIKQTNVELTKVASKMIEGVLYADRFYAHDQTHWNQAMANIAVPQGIIGDFDVSPVPSVNDCVSVSAMRYYKDAANTLTGDVAVAQRVSFTRDATKNQIHTVHLIASTGSFGITSGVASVASFSSTYGADAGPALLSVPVLGVINIQAAPGAAAVVTGAEITPVLPDGTFMQERGDVPAGQIIELLGGILFNAPLLACHVGGIPRKVFATFTSQKLVLQPAADIIKGTLQETGAVIKFPAPGDKSSKAAPTGNVEWSGSIEEYVVSAQASKDFTRKRVGYLRIYRDSNNTAEYREGAVVYTTRGENPVDISAALTSTLAFTGSGPLEWNT